MQKNFFGVITAYYKEDIEIVHRAMRSVEQLTPAGLATQPLGLWQHAENDGRDPDHTRRLSWTDAIDNRLIGKK